MGVSVFVARVGSKAELAAALADLRAHNAAPRRLMGERSPEEQEAVCPGMRVQLEAGARKMLAARIPEGDVASMMHAMTRDSAEKWSRGSDLAARGGSLVRYKSELWVEVTNLPLATATMPHGGADSTEFFERRFEAHDTVVRWYGTRGKPVRFMAAPMVASFDALEGVEARFAALLPEACEPARECDVAPIGGSTSASMVAPAAGLNAGLPYTMQRVNSCAQCGASGALYVCTKCGVVRYCGVACQKAHWRAGHKAA